MKVSCRWLEEMLGTPLDCVALADQLTKIGLEVKALHCPMFVLDRIVAGYIRHVMPHPHDSHLYVCQVDVGQNRSVQIVCAAAPPQKNSCVAVALAGGSSGGRTVSTTTTHGIRSDGMLCSGNDLGIAGATDALLILDNSMVAGADIVDCLQLNDSVMEFDLTPNRSDAMSVLGIAREVAALKRQPLNIPETDALPITHDRKVKVHIEQPQACPRYLGCVVTMLQQPLHTPAWLHCRLERCGIASISPIVDVMNYIMLETGQPMHAFDLRKLNGDINVRFAAAAESIRLLNGKDLQLNENTLVIADDDGAVAIAGIMGDQRSAVDLNTEEILIECAYFSPLSIAGRAQFYGLHTQASHRFERGVDFMLQHRAMHSACALLSQICGGRYGEVIETVVVSALPQRSPVRLSHAAINACLGISLEQHSVEEMLERLGMSLEPLQGGWKCLPPTYRFDLAIEEDLIEELGRFYGYDSIPSHRSISFPLEFNAAKDSVLRRLKHWCDRLVGYGYCEVITYSFTDPTLLEAMNLPSDLRLCNPISPELSAMRPSLLPNLLKILTYNLNRQRNRLRIFECGHQFTRCNGALMHTNMIAGLVYGPTFPEQWGQTQTLHDFHDVKNDIENLFAGLTASGKTIRYATCDNHPLLHPGLSASIFLDDIEIGCFGTFNPALEETCNIPRGVSLFELKIEEIPACTPAVYQPFSRYPLVRRDLSIMLAHDVPVADIIDAVESLQISALKELVVFDVYTGENLRENQKSVSLGLIFQKFFSTLNDEESEEYTNCIFEQLRQKFNVRLRS